MTAVLAIAPHPDDELIGAGGALIKHARAGHRVSLLQVVGREPTLGADIGPEEYAAEIKTAQERLGAAECVNLGAPSRDLSPSRKWRLALTSMVRRVAPAVVYLPHAGEADREHRVVHELAMDALWMAAADFFPEAGRPCAPPTLVLGYEVWTPMARHSYVEDITDVLDVKVHAMRAYRSQLRHVPWDAAIEGLARYRGASAQGRGAAEVFEVLQLGGPFPSVRAAATLAPFATEGPRA
ncbi:PIG-L deacetylase family protein [Nonomuraea angiospora]|uniref:PIG-L deacetylase family protein n=1 Tax=Nonomuraea angiospora TaxID=46172 RepID=UPI0029A7804A|nr:PIG-L deacetylase family protein [Nonomuraea angiospora]MDX3103368.1 PIG-L family deacetylase [Nonomuraea angiospora]